MKKRAFSIFLVLALLLTALAGCGQEGGGGSGGGDDDDDEQALATGYYRVLDEDEELVGYLQVKSSKIIVFDERGREGDTLAYEYNKKKDRYTIDDGELFGGDTFTVKKSKKALTLTADGDDYTLEEIKKDDIGGGNSKDGPALVKGWYEVLDEDKDLAGYLHVTSSKITVYDARGREDETLRYEYSESRERYTVEDGELFGGDTFTVKANQGLLTLTADGDRYILQEIDESEIGGTANPSAPADTPAPNTPAPVQSDAPASGSYSTLGYEDLVGGNDYFGLHAYLPDALWYYMDADSDDDLFSATSSYYDYDIGAELLFSTILSSGGNLAEAVDTAKSVYNGTYGSDADLLYSFLRDSMISALDQGYFLDEYLGKGLVYTPDEGDIMFNGETWRYCDVYLYDEDMEIYAYMSMNFWMEGDNMALVILGGIAEGPASGEMYDILYDIMYSLVLLD